MASKFYDSVSEKVAAIDVTQMKDSVRGSFQSASGKISSYWQGLQVSVIPCVLILNLSCIICRQSTIQLVSYCAG